MWTMISLICQARVLAALPALPHGKGASILILGGLLMLTVALVWSMLQPTVLPASHDAPGDRRQHRPVAQTAPQPSGAMPHVDWNAPQATHRLEPLLEAARQRGIGRMTVLATWPGRSLVRLDECPSCRRHANPGKECREAARMLREAAQQLGDQVTTEERRCRSRGHGACVFEVAWGGNA